jgi:hypothetical protein
VGDDSRSARGTRDRQRQIAGAILENLQPGDEFILFWMNERENVLAATVPLPSIEDDPPIPAELEPRLVCAAPHVRLAGGRSAREQALSCAAQQAAWDTARDQHEAAVRIRCEAQERFSAAVAGWRAEAQRALAYDPPSADISPIVNAINRGALAVLPVPPGCEAVVVVGGDAERWPGPPATVPPGSLEGLHVVFAPFRPDALPYDLALQRLHEMVSPGAPRSFEPFSADKPRESVIQHILGLADRS